MARTLAQLTLLLTGANACTPHIIEAVWGKDKPCPWWPPQQSIPHSSKILTLSKVAMNMVHIWMTDSAMNFLTLTSPSFQRLPPKVQQLLLHARDTKIYA